MTLHLSDIAPLRLWVGWREELVNGRKVKKPFDPVTSNFAESDNPKTWASRGEAEFWAIKNRGGIGLMFSGIDGGLHTAGIDLDTCRNPQTGNIEDWGSEVIERFKSYCEIS